MNRLWLTLIVAISVATPIIASGSERLVSTTFGPYRAVPANHVFVEPTYVKDWQEAASRFRPAPGAALAGLPSPRVKWSRARQLLLQSEILAAAANAERVAEERYPINDGDFTNSPLAEEEWDRMTAEHNALFRRLLQTYLGQIAYKHGLGLGEFSLIRSQSSEFFETISLIAPGDTPSR